MYMHLSILVLLISKHLIKGDPCASYKILDSANDYSRSAANDAGSLCDNLLVAGWYRIFSKAGERMPTECIYGGFRCGTTFSIWMNGEYPATGEVKNVTACAASYNGDCCAYSYDIQVKNCTNYLVYNLKPVTSCSQAYCFGAELPCPQGETSDNGFSPGCKYDECLEPNYKVLDQWQRSVNNTQSGTLCDNFLDAGWYRPTSFAGNEMPTVCPAGGFKCGTTYPIWMNGAYPSVGSIANVTACVSNYNGGCCTSSYDIQVKNCGDFYIYNLQHTTGCFQAYCFGSEHPCLTGQTSDNGGFTPGCEFYPCHSSNYKVLSGEMKRSSNYTLQMYDMAIDDSRLTTGWYRIDSVTGNDIVNQSVPMMQCGTLYPLWMKGNIPLVADKTVDRKVCRSGLISTCDSEQHIKVRNCGTYRTYYLGQLGDAQSAYCFGSLPVPETTTTTTTTTTRTTRTTTTTRKPLPTYPPGRADGGHSKEGDEKEKLYIWIIAGVLAVLSTGLLIYVILQVYKERNNAKRAVSCVSLSKPPPYDETMQNELNLQKVAKIGYLKLNIGVTPMETKSRPPSSTNFQQFKMAT